MSSASLESCFCPGIIIRDITAAMPLAQNQGDTNLRSAPITSPQSVKIWPSEMFLTISSLTLTLVLTISSLIPPYNCKMILLIHVMLLSWHMLYKIWTVKVTNKAWLGRVYTLLFSVIIVVSTHHYNKQKSFIHWSDFRNLKMTWKLRKPFWQVGGHNRVFVYM